MSRISLSRRQMLFALGASAAMLPSLRGGIIKTASAAPSSTTAPRRLVFFMTQHGTVYDSWKMPQAGDDISLAGLTSDAQMSRILKPLFPHRADLCVLDGIFMMSARLLDGTANHNAHSIGPAHALTGLTATQQNLAGGITIDQSIAASLLSKAPTSAASVDVGVYAGSQFSYTAPNVRVPVRANPQTAFDALFADFGTNASDRQKKNARRASILDFAQGELNGVRASLSATDKIRLDAHLQAVRDWELRLAASNVSCVVPVRPALSNAGPMSVNHAYGTVATEQFRNVASAFGCNLTNVATITLGQMPYQEFQDVVSWDMTTGKNDVHGDFAHRADDPNYAGQSDIPHAHEAMSGYHQKHAQQFAAFIDMLKKTPEPFDPTGKASVFDSTTVVWISELATGFHQFTPWPVVVAAGANVNIARGHALRWPTLIDRDVRGTAQKIEKELVGGGTPTSLPQSWKDVSHQNLLVSLSNVMGMTTSTVGDPRLCAGPLARFTV